MSRDFLQGIYSSRKIARACEQRVDFMAVTALAKPDFRTVAVFRQRHREALAGLFVQVLRLCQTAGLVQLGHVSLDGTKVRANASRHHAMSYERMVKREPELEAEVKAWFAQAIAGASRGRPWYDHVEYGGLDQVTVRDAGEDWFRGY